MDSGKIKTQKYIFKDPKIEELKSLISEIESPTYFRKKYGAIAPLMNLKMKNGIISTLVHFYDSLYQCFTFSDYQLMPILEEYSYLLGLPITDCVPFTGLEGEPKSHKISTITHLRKSKIEANMNTKGGIIGLPTQFLLEKARYLIKMKSTAAFEAIFALLVLYPQIFPLISQNHFLIGIN